MGKWVEGKWIWNWDWRGNLFERELPIFTKVLILINRYKLKGNSKDGWRWKHSSDGNYSTSSAYNHLHQSGEQGDRSRVSIKEFKLVWKDLTT